MYGLGILKGLSVTLKHFVNTYVDDFSYGLFSWVTDARYTPEAMAVRQSAKARGVFTVQYRLVRLRIALAAQRLRPREAAVDADAVLHHEDRGRAVTQVVVRVGPLGDPDLFAGRGGVRGVLGVVEGVGP